MLMRLAHVLSTGERQDMVIRDDDHPKHCIEAMLNYAIECHKVDQMVTSGNVVLGSC
jgi:hypothetical protein